MAAFGDFLDEVGDCVRRCLPRQVLVLGDFNARWSQWGDTRTNSRGRMLTDWAATLGLVLVNRSATSTCVAWRGSSIVDVTWATAELYRKIHGWRVADRMETLSDHLYIMMGAQMEAAARDRGARQREENRSRRPPPSTPRWRLKERDKDMLRAAVTVSAWSWDARGNNPPPTIATTLGSVDKEADEFHGYMSAACDASMPRAVPGGRSDRCVYWWTPEIADMRASCVQARRRFLRARRRRRTRDEEEISRCYEDYRETRRALQREIKLAKARSWDQLIESVDSDPWGRPYRIVTKKLRPSPPPRWPKTWIRRYWIT